MKASCRLGCRSRSSSRRPRGLGRRAGGRGQNNVAAPKRTKTVPPVYPPEAQARGQRGIVIVELVIDTQGKVSSAQVMRSIPPFDEAALAAVRQWEYEVTKVDGKPVSVKLTVPITFAMKMPEIASRQEGIPELRAGAFPPLPPGRERPPAPPPS